MTPTITKLCTLLDRVEAGNLDWLNNDLANIDPSYNEHNCQVPKYCASIDAAVAFSQAVLPGWRYYIDNLDGVRLKYSVGLFPPRAAKTTRAVAVGSRTAPLAIIAATLRAKIAESEVKNAE